MKTKWIVLAIGVAVLVTVCDSKKKKSNKIEVNREQKSNEEYKSNELNSNSEKSSKAKHTKNQKTKDEKTQTGFTEDSTEKTPASEVVESEAGVGESVAVEEADPVPSNEEKPKPAPKKSKPVKEPKRYKGKSAKETRTPSKKEKVTTANIVPEVDEPAEEATEKTEL